MRTPEKALEQLLADYKSRIAVLDTAMGTVANNLLEAMPDHVEISQFTGLLIANKNHPNHDQLSGIAYELCSLYGVEPDTETAFHVMCQTLTALDGGDA